MVDAASAAEPLALGTVAIVGGGCYGSFYARQLARARAGGKAAIARVLVVDRDPGCQAAREGLTAAAEAELVVAEWETFFDAFLAAPRGDGPPDAIVPSPLMPHLMFEWLLRRARARWPGRAVGRGSADAPFGTPYDVRAPDGTRYVSFADWICPTHCVEPATCPVIRGPRSWTMLDALPAAAERAGAVPVALHCRHRVFGVGMFDVSEVQAGDRTVAGAGAAAAARVAVGTVSHCHGAVAILEIGPPPG